MTSSHELARQLLELPDAPVLLAISWPGGGEVADSDETLIVGHAIDEGYEHVRIQGHRPEAPEFGG